MSRNKCFSTAVAILVVFVFVGSNPAQAAVNSMPPLSRVTVLTTAQRLNIQHDYSKSPLVRWTVDDCAVQSRLTSELKFFSANNIQAIFFFTGVCMRDHPTYRLQIIRAGHLLGNHSFNHTSYTTLTSGQVYAQIRHIYSVVPTTTPKLCRPPFGNGAFIVAYINAMARAGCRPAYWTVDTRDWDRLATVASILGHVRLELKSGGVILMHGTGKYTLAAQPGIVKIEKSMNIGHFHLR